MSLLVPANKIQTPTIKAELRKNFTLKGVKIVMINSTNMTVTIEEVSCVNDPAVLDKASAGQVAVTRETFQQIRGMLKDGGANFMP